MSELLNKQIALSGQETLFHNGQEVKQEDLELDQNHVLQLTSAINHNHLGSGILPEFPTPRILFDSDSLDSTQAALLAANQLDGTGLHVAKQPSDVSLGNQLAITLSNSTVLGRHSVKIALIGLDFEGTIQTEYFYFHKNETQISRRHYKQILTFFVNDFKGNSNCSRIYGGKIVIRESTSYEMSRDPVASSQTLQPNLFWRDFKIADKTSTLEITLQTALGATYDAATALDIKTSNGIDRTLLPNDVLFQVGQKFQATTNQIQKVTFLLGVDLDSTKSLANQFDWTGDLVVTIYSLQTTVISPSEIVPELGIEFDPQNVPLAQLSFNQTSLRDIGYVLTDMLQPIDFVFSSANKVANPSLSAIVPGQYYIVTLRRSGASVSGTLFFGGTNIASEQTRISLFTGTEWLDLPNENLWFQVWSDAVKLSSGQAYDFGKGIKTDKTTVNSLGTTIDFTDGFYNLLNSGRNIVNYGILQAQIKESTPVQDLVTGTPVNTRQEFISQFSFVNSPGLASLQLTTDPLRIGACFDNNPKLNPILDGYTGYPGLAKDDVFIIINPNSDLRGLNLLGSILYPNTLSCNSTFKIVDQKLCTRRYGDVNGDGSIADDDLIELSSLLGESIFYESTQTKIIDGTINILDLLSADLDNDGYVSATDYTVLDNYINKVTTTIGRTSFDYLKLTLQEVIGRDDSFYDCDGYYVRIDGYGGTTPTNELDLNTLVYDGYQLIPSLQLDSAFTTVPFAPVSFSIKPNNNYWQDHQILLTTNVKETEACFAQELSNTDYCAANIIEQCLDLNDQAPEVDPGGNNYYFPGDIVLAKNGQLKIPSGEFYKVDLEIGQIILELPAGDLTNASINVFNAFVSESSPGTALTSFNYPAMKYADCSFVQRNDYLTGKVKIAVSLMSITNDSDFDGYAVDGYDGYDGYSSPQFYTEKVSLSFDSLSSILSFTFKDLGYEELDPVLRAKILIQVYLKKAGWNNQTLTVTKDQLLGLIAH